MEAITLIIAIILLALILTLRSTIIQKLELLKMDIDRLNKLITEQKSKKEDIKSEVKTETEPTKTSPEPIKSSLLPEPEVTEIKTETQRAEKIEQPEAELPYKAVTSKTVYEPPYIHKKAKVRRDVEEFIGENLISKIGIVILVLGVGYFVKYAIDRDWINEFGRVALGFLAGGLLMTIAYKLRISYKTFSSILTGGGLAVLYVTSAIAYHQYHILSQAIAFAIMVVITIFSVLLSLFYDKKELAIFALLGGFASPFMASSGEGNYIVLFTYILILNAGILVIAYFKRWHILNLLAYLFTVILYTSWMIKAFWDNNYPPRMGALIFASMFYLIFFLVNIINNVKERKPFNAAEILMILSNNLFFFAAGLIIMHNYKGGLYNGLFTILLGLYNFLWIAFLYRKQQIDKNLLYLLIGLVLSFVSISIPIQLKGNSITIFWAAEMVILLWISQKSGLKILKAAHFIILALVLISIIMDWNNLYSHYSGNLPIVLNRAFITGVVSLMGLYGLVYLTKFEKDEYLIKAITVKNYKVLIITIFIIIAYLVMFIELKYQANKNYNSSAFRQTIYGVYNYWFIFAIMLFAFIKKWKTTLKGLCVASLALILIYTFYYNFKGIQIRNEYLAGLSVSLPMFLFHYIGLLAIIGIAIFLFREKEKTFPADYFWSRLILWFLAIITLIISSIELDNIALIIWKTDPLNTNEILHQTHRVGYPILWATLSFVLMIWGMRSKIKDYRILSLSLLGLIILKLFLFDVWTMSEGGRIIAFLFLGIVLLIVSFMYQKLKKLIINPDDETTNTFKE